MSGPGQVRALHEMVGLGRHASVSELRYAYEQAMSRATRSGDFPRANALSRAVDELSHGKRELVYDRGDSVRTGQPNLRPARSTTVRPAKTRRPARTRAGRTGRSSGRFVAYGVLVPAIIAISIYVALHVQPGHGGNQQPVYPPAKALVQSTTPVAVKTVAAPTSAVGPGIVIPVNARTGANRMATVLCQPGPGQPGYHMTAPRGALVACTNGATPYVIN